MREGNSDGAGACADVEDAAVCPRRFQLAAFRPFKGKTIQGWGTQVCGKFENLFNEVFGFGAGNEHVRRDAKGQAVELRFAGDVLDGLAFVAAVEQRCVADRIAPGEVFFEMGQQPGSILADEMKQQCFGVAAGAVGMGAGAQARLRPCRAIRAEFIRQPGCRPSIARPGSG